MTTNLRSRKPADGSNANFRNNEMHQQQQKFFTDGEKSDGKILQRDRRLLSTRHWIFLIFYLVFVYLFAFWMDARLPKPLTMAEAGTGRFCEERARSILTEMVGYGPKPSGSYAAEVLTKNFILIQIAEVQRTTNAEFHKIELDVQRPSECFEFHFITGYVSCYKNITNIAVRLTPAKAPSNFSVLINCHFDSVPASPGATDDLAACAAMLEMLSILSKQPRSLKHNVIFLFNGAEENFMQASHGFITKHKWRHEIRAFVNLEGAGAGGREFLFQEGPANTWLLHAYLDSAAYPHGSILAQEVFESGILISDTDFRVFKDYGRLSGLDLAYVRNGYLYHTEFDNVDFIPPGSIQRLGDNVLETVRTIADSDCLATYCPEKEDKVLFFDVLGVFVVRYKRKYATIFNYFVCLLIVLKIYTHCRDSSRLLDESRGHVTTNSRISSAYSSSSYFLTLAQDVPYTYGDFVRQFGVTLLAMLAGGLTLLVQTQVVRLLGLTMFWYSNWLLLVPVYIMPSVATGFAAHLWLGCCLRKKREYPFQMEHLTSDCNLFTLGLILFAITALGVQSTYFVLNYLLFPLMRDSLLLAVCKLRNQKRTAQLVLICHIITLIPPVVLGMYALVEVLHVFLPMMGRSGAVLCPEYLIAAICFLNCTSSTLLMSSLLYITRNILSLINWTYVFCLIGIIWIACPGVCEPFQFSTTAPRWRKLHSQHVRRRYPSSPSENAPLVEESGVWLAPLDYKGVDAFPNDFHTQELRPPHCVPADGYCGLPYYLPARRYLVPNVTVWMPTPNDTPKFSKPISIKVIDKKRVDKNRVVLTIAVDGADHISCYFTPLNSWYIDYMTYDSKTVSVPGDQDTLFIYMANVQVNEPWIFSLALFTTEPSPTGTYEDPILYAGVASHDMHGKYATTPTLSNISATISQRRQRSHRYYHWKWCVTLTSWTTDYLGQYYFY